MDVVGAHDPLLYIKVALYLKGAQSPRSVAPLTLPGVSRAMIPETP